MILNPNQVEDLTKVHEILSKIDITQTPLSFEYKNWKGITSIRNVIPMETKFINSDFHEGKQWIMIAYDLDKKANREFAMNDIIKMIKI